MAHVELAYALQSPGGPAHRAQANAELTKAFSSAIACPSGSGTTSRVDYFMAAALDRRQAIAALRRAIALDSSDIDAVNSLAVTLNQTRDDRAAVSMYKLALAGEPDNGTILGNLAVTYNYMGDYAAVDSVMAVFVKDRIPFPTRGLWYTTFWLRHEYDSAERVARAGLATPSGAADAHRKLGALAVLRGRLTEGDQQYAQGADGKPGVADPVKLYTDAVLHGLIEGVVRGNSARGVALLDAAVRAAPVATIPLPQDQSLQVAQAYAELGASAKARAVLKDHDEKLDISHGVATTWR